MFCEVSPKGGGELCDPVDKLGPQRQKNRLKASSEVDSQVGGCCNGTENGNYYIVYWDHYIGIMKKKMETITWGLGYGSWRLKF